MKVWLLSYLRLSLHVTCRGKKGVIYVFHSHGSLLLRLNSRNGFIHLDPEQEQLNMCPIPPNRQPWERGSRSE